MLTRNTKVHPFLSSHIIANTNDVIRQNKRSNIAVDSFNYLSICMRHVRNLLYSTAIQANSQEQRQKVTYAIQFSDTSKHRAIQVYFCICCEICTYIFKRIEVQYLFFFVYVGKKIQQVTCKSSEARFTRDLWNFISQWKRKIVLLSIYLYLAKITPRNAFKFAVSTLDQLSRDPCLLYWVL